jgi:hypothetical protein
MSLKFNGAWRFAPPPDARWRSQTIATEAVDEFGQLIARTATQGRRQEVLEHFKRFFCNAAGKTYMRSSEEGWAETDLRRYMDDAAENAPLFLEAFYDACDTISRVNEQYYAPDVNMINALCERHKIGYELAPPNLILREDGGPSSALAEKQPAASVEATITSNDLKAPSAPTIGSMTQRSLRVFLCHSSGDKAAIRELYGRLRNDDFDPWLDEAKLLPGQDWNLEIRKAVKASDTIIVCLSRESINKAGYVQKEIKYALDVADEQPEGAIFLIPLRLEECDVPQRLGHLHWVDLFDEQGYQRLLHALQERSLSLGLIKESAHIQAGRDQRLLRGFNEANRNVLHAVVQPTGFIEFSFAESAAWHGREGLSILFHLEAKLPEANALKRVEEALKISDIEWLILVNGSWVLRADILRHQFERLGDYRWLNWNVDIVPEVNYQSSLLNGDQVEETVVSFEVAEM